ncbi:cytidylate kinase, partial [bacterium]|nr:cytidylate kinase [bacterium]
HRILIAVRENLSSLPDFQIQYIEIVNCETMAPCPTIERGECAIAVAGYLGKTRLIDNLILR